MYLFPLIHFSLFCNYFCFFVVDVIFVSNAGAVIAVICAVVANVVADVVTVVAIVVVVCLIARFQFLLFF